MISLCKIFRPLCVIFLLFLDSSCSFPFQTSSSVQPEGRLLIVSCETADSYDILSANPVKLKKGENAVFTLSFKDGYVFDHCSYPNFTYSQGSLTCFSVQYPSTVTIASRKLEKFAYSFLNDDSKGTLSSSQPNGTYWEGTQITLSAQPSGSNVFAGYSENGSIYDDDPKTIQEFSLTYSFVLTKNVVVYSNYVQKGYPVINYHGMGGLTKDGRNNLIQVVKMDTKFRPAVIRGQEIFFKDNSSFVSFNTKSDGSGQCYGSSWRIGLETAYLDLFCIWEKWTDKEFFKIEKSESSVSLLSYLGNAETVVIPNTFDGLTVETIKTGCFIGKKFSRLVLNPGLLTIESTAFQSCSKAQDLIFFDALANVSDDSFFGCHHFGSLLINSSVNKTTLNNYTCFYKYESLFMHHNAQRLIHISDSNVFYGLDCSIFQNGELSKYSCINLAVANLYKKQLIYAILMSELTEGDVVCFSAIPINWGIRETNYNVLSINDWHSVEMNYALMFLASKTIIFEESFPNFWSSFSSFIQDKKTGHGIYPPNYSNSQMDDYGDYMMNTDPGHEETWANISTFSYTLPSSEDYLLINNCFHNLTIRGVAFYQSFGPIDYYSIKKDIRDENATYSLFDSACQSLASFPVISSCKSFVYPGNYFFDNYCHLNTAYRGIRTEQLNKDLITQMKKEGLL